MDFEYHGNIEAWAYNYRKFLLQVESSGAIVIMDLIGARHYNNIDDSKLSSLMP